MRYRATVNNGESDEDGENKKRKERRSNAVTNLCLNQMCHICLSLSILPVSHLSKLKYFTCVTSV